MKKVKRYFDMFWLILVLIIISFPFAALVIFGGLLTGIFFILAFLLIAFIWILVAVSCIGGIVLFFSGFGGRNLNVSQQLWKLFGCWLGATACGFVGYWLSQLALFLWRLIFQS
ncbi:MAG: hypothetical protein FWC97_02330 [Treponema sp.]|nr:hypothetical protein [Treponema sp.]